MSYLVEYCRFGNFRVIFILRIFYFRIICKSLNLRTSIQFTNISENFEIARQGIHELAKIKFGIYNMQITCVIVGFVFRRIYLVKPRMTLMKILADQILLEKSRGEDRKYRIVMVPRKV